jgi:hypothetical protein
MPQAISAPLKNNKMKGAFIQYIETYLKGYKIGNFQVSIEGRHIYDKK